MAKKINRPQRVHSKFLDDMERVLDTRIKMNLLKRKDAKFPKATELLTRTQGYKQSLEELKTKRERRK